MNRVVWLTDIHLNFLTPQSVDAFLASIIAAQPTSVLIGGDIAEAHDVIGYFERIDDALERPIYFVLGNHDYYFGSIYQMRSQVDELCARRPNLHYLTHSGALSLAEGVGIVGHDGWADGRLGDFERSVVSMYDYKLIKDLVGLNKRERWEVLKRLGDEAAAHIRKVLPAALDQFPHVMLLTHVPPLREACWHEGQVSDDQWAPHFTCKAVGDAVLEIMGSRPERQLTVLCGHTHGCGESRPLPNVLILTGGAQYGRPEIQRIFEFP